jgi:hypothetical protein
METRTRADQVVDALIEAGLLTGAQRDRSVELVGRTLGGPDTASAPARRGIPQLVEVVAYLGGALVLAAGSLFLVEQWGSLGFAARTALIAVVTVVLAAAGVAVVRSGGAVDAQDHAHDVRRRLGGTLLVAAAVAAGLLVGHTLDRYVGQGTLPSVHWPTVVGAVVVLIGSVAAYRMAPTAVALLGMLGAAVTADMSLAEGVDLGSDGDVIGVSLLGIAVVWLALTEAGVFHERTVARTLGVALALLGAQVPAMDGTHAWFGYLLTAAVAVVGIVVYLRSAAWPYLAVAVLAVTLVVPEAVSDWTEGSLGAVGGVLVAGITLLGASLAGYRLRAETTGTS